MTDASDLLADIDAGGSPADFRIHTAAFGTLLATLVLNDPSFTLAEPVLSQVTFPASEAVVVADGTAVARPVRR